MSITPFRNPGCEAQVVKQRDGSRSVVCRRCGVNEPVTVIGAGGSQEDREGLDASILLATQLFCAAQIRRDNLKK